MKKIRDIMGMPVTIEITDPADEKDFDDVFGYFEYVDEKFSPFKAGSEVTKINTGSLRPKDFSQDMKSVLRLSEKTKQATQGFFDIYYKGVLEPLGLVKGWAIQNAAKILKKQGFKNFYIDAGGDIQVSGKNPKGQPWKIGIKNPFNENEIIKVLSVGQKGVATSGTYIRGQHIFNPKTGQQVAEIVSLTVIGPNIYEADRFATGAFAMGKDGIQFIERLAGFEAMMVDRFGMATMTSGFKKYEI